MREKYIFHGEVRAELERIARMLCKSLGFHENPDMLVIPGEPQRTYGGYIPDLLNARAAWLLYLGAAKAVFDDYQQQKTEEKT